MKRSSHLRLTLLTTALPAALMGCGPSGPETGAIVTSRDECRASRLTAEECERAWSEVLAMHPALAPRFDSELECRQSFGSCASVEERGRTHWTPPLTGYLVGYDSTQRGEDESDGYLYVYRGSLPLYRDFHDRSYYNPRGELVGRDPGPVHGRAGNTTPPASPLTVSRGGFGATSADTARFARSNFGS